MSFGASSMMEGCADLPARLLATGALGPVYTRRERNVSVCFGESMNKWCARGGKTTVACVAMGECPCVVNNVVHFEKINRGWMRAKINKWGAEQGGINKVGAYKKAFIFLKNIYLYILTK